MSEPYIKDGALYQGGRMIASTIGTENLRQFFLAERDQELGRWRAPMSLNVVYPAPDGRSVRVVNEIDGFSSRWTRKQATQVLNECCDGYEEANAFFAAHPEPKPWHDAKPGEVWVVTWDGRETPCHVVESTISSNGLVFNDTSRETPGVLAPCITDARRIWPEKEAENGKR